MKRWPFIVTLAGTLLSASMAFGLPITGGQVRAHQGGDLAPVLTLQGDDFRLTGVLNMQIPLPYNGSGALTGTLVDLSVLLPIGEPRSQQGVTLVYQGQTYRDVTGSLTLTTAPFDPVTDGTFTMSGSVQFGTETVSVDGHGKATFIEGFSLGSRTQMLGAQYDFASGQVAGTPEPATLLLIGTGLAAVGIRWRRACMRRGVTSASA